jgi:hypothetical protein
MVEFVLTALAVLILLTFWPHSQVPVGGISLGASVFVAAPVGWLLLQSPVAGAGWMLLSFAAMVLVRWLREKWHAQ